MLSGQTIWSFWGNSELDHVETPTTESLFPVRRLLALLTVPVVFLAACGDSDEDDTEASESAAETPEFCGDNTFADDSEPSETSEPPEVELPDPAEDDPALDVVTVTGEFGEEPTMEVSAPVETEGAVRRVLTEGDGDPVDGGLAIPHMKPFSGQTGDPLQGAGTYGGPPQPIPVGQQMLQSGMAVLVPGIVGVPAGSRVLMAFPVEEILPPETDVEEAGLGLEAGDSMLWVIDLLPTTAVGTEVEPEAGLPTVAVGEDGTPSIEIPDADPPAELVSQTLIEGDGPEVTEGQQILAQYVGVCWEDGGEFDSSWSAQPPMVAAPQQFTMGSVIEGWNEGIPGQTVGSRVLLVVPSEMGYGSQGTANIPPDRTLVFVVDILAVGDPLTQPTGPGSAPQEGGEEPPAEGTEE